MTRVCGVRFCGIVVLQKFLLGVQSSTQVGFAQNVQVISQSRNVVKVHDVLVESAHFFNRFFFNNPWLFYDSLT